MAINKVTLPVARKIVGMTQSTLAEICGVSVYTVGNWESGKTEPTISQAYKIADAVGRHINEIKFLP